MELIDCRYFCRIRWIELGVPVFGKSLFELQSAVKDVVVVESLIERS